MNLPTISVSKTIDYTLNRLPIIDWFNGKKTIIAGAIAGLAGTFTYAATFLPVYSASLLQAADFLFKVAGAIGTLGVTGKLAKYGAAKTEEDKLELAASKLDC